MSNEPGFKKINTVVGTEEYKLLKSLGIKDPTYILEILSFSVTRKENYFNHIKQLELEYPGSVKILHENFNIINFDRYSVDRLILQIDQMDLQEPYSVVVYPYADFGDSFLDGHTIPIFDEFNAKKGKIVRITEAGSAMMLTKNFVRLDRKYGAKNKISGVLWGGHSTGGEVVLSRFPPEGYPIGEGVSYNEITTKDVSKLNPDLLSSFFEYGSYVILDACYTGKIEKLAKMLSLKLKNTIVFAPGKDVDSFTLESLKGVSEPLVTFTYRGIVKDTYAWLRGSVIK